MALNVAFTVSNTISVMTAIQKEGEVIGEYTVYTVGSI